MFTRVCRKLGINELDYDLLSKEINIPSNQFKEKCEDWFLC